MHLLTEYLRPVFKGRIEENHHLAPHTTYNIGGPADVALFPENASELMQLVAFLFARKIPYLVLGGGSNVLISDRGVRGAVIITSALNHLRVQETEILAGAGAFSHHVASAALSANLGGAEFLTWLPGTIGGASYMNARAYDSEIADIIVGATVVTPEGTLKCLEIKSEQFDYKRSPFQDSQVIIADVRLRLHHEAHEDIEAFMRMIEESRKAKHEMDYPSCGCVFKNCYAEGVPAGRVIDSCGLKGWRIGDAQVSPHHANFIINLGQAKAADVHALIKHVQHVVEEKTKIVLEPEVQIIGEW